MDMKKLKKYMKDLFGDIVEKKTYIEINKDPKYNRFINKGE